MTQGPALRRSERIGIAAAALAAIGYGSSFPATAYVLRTFPPLATAGIVATAGLLFLVALAAVGVLPRPSPMARSRQGLARLSVLSVLGGVGFIVGMNVAVQLSGATVAGFVATLYAVFAAMLAVPLLGERLTPIALGAFGLALLGTVLLADTGSTGGSLTGIAFALGAAISFALYLVLARRWGGPNGLDGTSMALAVLLSRGPLLLCVELGREPGALMPAALDLPTVLVLLYLAIVPSGLAQVLVLESTRRVAARRTSAWLLLTPLTSAVLAIVILGETATPLGLVGGALVVAGIAGASAGRGGGQPGAAIDQPRRPT